MIGDGAVSWGHDSMWLWALAAVFGFGLWCWIQGRCRRRRLEQLLGPRASVVADVATSGSRWRWWFGCLAFAAAVCALLQPRWGVVDGESVAPRGVDVVLCVDVSRSMLARDVAPSRLEAARAAIRETLERVRGDRFGLVAFAGTARLIVPLTHDVATLAELCRDLDPGLIRRGGTDLGAALDRARQTLTDGRSVGSGHRAIVLVTDGEDHGSAGLRAAQRCAEEGIAVHCVGYGSVLGSKIALGGSDPGDRSESFLVDRGGRDVLSRLDEQSLRAIAQASATGTYLGAASSGGADRGPIRTLYEARIVPVGRQLAAATDRDEREERFQWPLLVACLSWLCELWVLTRGSEA